jgi:hypothetical protein
MSRELTRTTPARRRRFLETNTIAFPRSLREAIPDLCDGRVLQLDSINGDASDSAFGPRVHLKLVAKETGKLTGEFTVRIDLDPGAARALAETLAKLAERIG